MTSETDRGQDLIEAFFDALRLRRLDRCQRLLQSMAALSHQQPAMGSWYTYLDGIMAFELQRDWAKAEHAFAGLLDQENVDPGMRVRVLYALGRSLDAQGRWQKAIASFERSQSTAAELGQTVDQAKAWKHVAITCCKGFTHGDFSPGELDKAVALCHRALGVLGPIPDPSPDVAWLVGSIWNTLGLLHRNLGRWDEAVACYERDLDLCRALDDRYGEGLSFGNLGEIYYQRGRASWPQALEAYHRALTIVREFDDRYEETEVLANLGFLHHEMGDDERAIEYYAQAIDRIERLRTGVSDEEARAGFFSTVVDTYAHAVLLYAQMGQDAKAFNTVERARSRAFLDTLAAGSTDLLHNASAPTMTLSEVQAALPDDMLLVEYFTTGLIEAQESQAPAGQTPPHERPARHRFPPARTLVLAVTSRTIQVRDLGLSPNDLLPRRLDSVVERHFIDPHIRRTLYDKLLAPVEGLFSGRRRLYLVPHGPLHYLPFQALTDAKDTPLLHKEGPELVYAPSASILFSSSRQRTDRDVPAQSLKPCLALGYNGPGSLGLRASGHDRAGLRFAEDEARSVAQQTGGQALAGPMPKKATLYEQAENYRLLHFSCHGEFDPQSPLASGLRLAPDEELTALDVLEHLRLHCDLVTLSACESGLSRVRRGDELVGLVRAFLRAGTPALVCTLWRVDEGSTRILMERFYDEIEHGANAALALKKAQLTLQNLGRRELESSLSTTCDTWQGISTHRPGNYELSAGGAKDERILTDPYYWAPFILVGKHKQV